MCPVFDLVFSIPITDGFPRFENLKNQNGYFANAPNQPPSSRSRAARSRSNIIGNSILESHGLETENNIAVTKLLAYIDSVQSGERKCSKKDRTIVLDSFGFNFLPEYFYGPFKDQVDKAVHLANTLNNLFLYKDQGQVLYDDVVYFALSQSFVENDTNIVGCGIAFAEKQYPLRKSSMFWPYAYRVGKKPETMIVVSDLSKLYNYTNVAWFTEHQQKTTVNFQTDQSVLFTNQSDADIGKFERYLFRRNKTVKVTRSDGFWGDPFYDCLLRKWIVSFSLPFYQIHGDTGRIVFKGVVVFDVDVTMLEINQCAEDEALFSNSHRCRKETTKCVHIPGNGFAWGSYQCHCNGGFYFPDNLAANKYFDGRTVEKLYYDLIQNVSSDYLSNYQCLPCRKGCEECAGEVPCIVEYNVLLRGIPLGIQSFCLTVTIVLAMVIIRLRKAKVMRTSMWILLEMVLFGALLLYATVVIQYFEPTTLTCVLVPWFREVGFAVVYGALLLKIYRILAEFQSRKAHRVHVRDRDLLKYLAVIVIITIGYMAAWTAVNMDHLTEGATLVDTGTTRDKLLYKLCKSHWWDYVIELSEFLFLCLGIYMCYCVRSAPSDYSERKYVSAAICYEAILSFIFYVLRHIWWLDLHPDYLFLMYFIRCQLTVTVVLILVLGPKLWYAHRPMDDDLMRNRAYSQSDVQDNAAPETMKLNVGISSNGDVDVGEISLTEMDPEDIRAELKRLYTQLQIYKTKTMRKDNPHISKRRGGRKQTHRRFSLQAFHHKHRHHHSEHEHDHEMSKTPEESTNSAEAMAMSMEPTGKDDRDRDRDTHERSAPSVSFKPGHK
ncbi:hypothetical protein SNE40_023265 [Patella caerulea]|uniref:G-protein coupled receptors family 3 profile domain-containing protein n=1 Tax=Patella caerulea TaxID=87958 RepID=A0AAN8GG97_PATCE